MGSKEASPYGSEGESAGSIYDKIRRTGVLTIPDQTPAPSPWSPQEFERSLGELLWRATVIDAGSATRYYWLDIPDETELGVGHYPNLRPPFEAFFVEQFDAQLAKKFSEDRHAASIEEEFPDYGGLFWAVDLSSPRTDRALRLRTWEALSYALEEGTYDGAVRWGLWGFLFSTSATDPLVRGPEMTWLLPIEDNGSVATDAGGYDPAVLSIPHGIHPDQNIEGEQNSEELWRELQAMLFAVCAINSRLSELRPTGETLYPRFALDIDSLTAKLNGLGNAREAELAHALLVCRSYFHTAIRA